MPSSTSRAHWVEGTGPSRNRGFIPVAYSALRIGDFNHDGKQDLVVAGYNAAAIFLGNGDGNFEAGATYPVGAVPTWITSGDFNGDGTLDLVIGATGNIGILLGNGDGTFQTPQHYNVPIGTDLISVDLNSDGILDL